MRKSSIIHTTLFLRIVILFIRIYFLGTCALCHRYIDPFWWSSYISLATPVTVWPIMLRGLFWSTKESGLFFCVFVLTNILAKKGRWYIHCLLCKRAHFLLRNHYSDETSRLQQLLNMTESFFVLFRKNAHSSIRTPSHTLTFWTSPRFPSDSWIEGTFFFFFAIRE